MAELLTSNVNGTLTINTVYVVNSTSLGSEPVVTAANTMANYSKNVANVVLEYNSIPSVNNAKTSVDAVVQNFMGFKSVFMIRPSLAQSSSNTAGFTTLGCTANVNANTCLSNVLSGNATPILQSCMARTVLGANNIATGNAGVIANANLVWGGGSTGNGGGYIAVIRFSQIAKGTGQNVVAGMANITSLVPTATDWKNNTNFDIMAVTANASGNLGFIVGAAGSARTLTDLGTSFNYNTTDVIEVIVYCAPGGASGGFRVRNLSNGAETSGAITSNMPSANHFMQPFVQTFNNTTTAANVAVYNIYVETDF